MWSALAAGLLGGALCIDACVTLVIVVLSVVAVAWSPPPTLHGRASPGAASARRVEPTVKEEEAEERREMVANPRRSAETHAAHPASEHHVPPTSHGFFVGNRARDAHLRLMQTMKNELDGARLHQFEGARVSRA